MIISEMVEELFKDEHLTDKHKKIIEAAIFIFAENGYSGTSTREIAVKAGVAEGTIFRYYRTKKELLLTIMDKTLTRLKPNEITNYFYNDNSCLKDFIKTLIRGQYYLVKRYKPIIKIFLQEIAFQKLNWEPYFSLYYKTVKKEFRSFLTRQNKGEIIKIEPEVAINLMLSTIVGYLIIKFFLLPEENTDKEVEIEIITNYFINGILT